MVGSSDSDMAYLDSILEENLGTATVVPSELPQKRSVIQSVVVVSAKNEVDADLRGGGTSQVCEPRTTAIPQKGIFTPSYKRVLTVQGLKFRILIGRKGQVVIQPRK